MNLFMEALMAYLLLDTNAVYDFSRNVPVAEGIKKLAKERNLKIAIAPMVLVECITKSYEDENFRVTVVKDALEKINLLNPVILCDQDVLLESFAQGNFHLENKEKNWEIILRYFSKCIRENDTFICCIPGNKIVINAKLIYDCRNRWEQRYKQDWIKMLDMQGIKDADTLSQEDYEEKTSGINPSFLEQNAWDEMFFSTMQARSGMKIEDERKQTLLSMVKYESQEYQTIWRKVISDGYKPFSNSKKNDYNDMAVISYAGIPDVYVFSDDLNMSKKSNLRQDGKLFVRSDVLVE